MSWTKAVLRLQEIDLELESINQRLGEIAISLKDNATLESAQKAVQASKADAQEAHKGQETLEFELDRVERKLKQTQSRLYGGKIRNPRELEDLQAEAKSLRKRIAGLEDDLLEAMIICEEADTQARDAQTHLRTTEEQREEQHNALIEEKAALYAQGNALTEEREGLYPAIPPAILDSYQYLRKRRGGTVVAYLHNRTCMLCGVEATKPIQNKVRAVEEAYCEGCGRLLVAK